MTLKDKRQEASEESNCEFARYLLVAGTVYWLINFVLTPSLLFPIHHDDYSLLGAGFENLRWLVERPVSTNIAYFMGEMGATYAFALMSILTIVIPPMVLYFCARLLDIKVGWFLTIAFSIMTFSHLAVFWHGRYLGLITNLSSHFFGCISLIALLRARRSMSLSAVLVAVIAYSLSVFSKEDFLLPPLLLIAYFGAAIFFPVRGLPVESIGRLSNEKRWWLKTTLSFIAIAFASILFSFLVRNPFLAGVIGQVGDTAPYAVNLSPPVLWAAFVKIAVEYSPWYMVVSGLAFIVLWVKWKTRRRELLLLALTIFCLILPYALISNNLPAYRVFAWLPWLSALIVAAAAFLLRVEAGVQTMPKLTIFFGLTFVAASLWIAYSERLPRLMVAGWYEAVQRKNERMVDSILINKPDLVREEVVGIVGVEALSPWSKSAGTYLQRKLGFVNRWVVFVDSNSIFFTINESVPNAYISVVSSQKLCEKPDLLVMKFNASGRAVAVRAAELCATHGAKN